MDPFTLVVLLAVAGYCVAAPDRRTLAASRGTAGAARSAVAGGARQVRSDWVAGRPYRQAVGRRVRARFRRNPWGTAAVNAWDGAKFAVRAGRGTGRVAYRTGRAAARDAGQGYRVGAKRAREKRDVKRAERQAGTPPTPDPRPDTGIPPTPDPTPGAGSTTPTRPPTGESPEMKDLMGGELTTTSDLRAETGDLRQLTEDVREALERLNKYLTGLGDRYAGAPFGTAKLSKAVTNLGEHAKAVDPVVADNILDQATELEEALTEAENLGEHADSVAAEGEIHAFQPA